MRGHSSHCSQMGPIHPAIFDPATLIWPSWSDIFFHQTSLRYKPISCYSQIFVAEGHIFIVNTVIMIMMVLIMTQRIISSHDLEKPAVLVTCVFCLPQVAMMAKPNKRKKLQWFLFNSSWNTKRLKSNKGILWHVDETLSFNCATYGHVKYCQNVVVWQMYLTPNCVIQITQIPQMTWKSHSIGWGTLQETSM